MFRKAFSAVIVAVLAVSGLPVLGQSKREDTLVLRCPHKFGTVKYTINTSKKTVLQQWLDYDEGVWSDPEPWRQGSYSSDGFNYISSFSFDGEARISNTWSPQDPDYNYWIDYIKIDLKAVNPLSIRHTASPKKDGVHCLDDNCNKMASANQQIDETYVSSCDIYSFPFQRNPKSFAQYLNGFSWQDGKERVFEKLGNCSTKNDETYSCTYGYTKITDPVNGKRFCELIPRNGQDVVKYSMAYSGLMVDGYKEGNVEIGRLGNCRKVLF